MGIYTKTADVPCRVQSGMYVRTNVSRTYAFIDGISPLGAPGEYNLYVLVKEVSVIQRSLDIYNNSLGQ